MSQASPWLILIGVLCLWPLMLSAISGVLAFMAGRGYRLRLERP